MVKLVNVLKVHLFVKKHIVGGPFMATQHGHWQHLVPPGGQEGGDTQGKPHCDRLPSLPSSHVRVITMLCFREAHPASWHDHSTKVLLFIAADTGHLIISLLPREGCLANNTVVAAKETLR